MPKEIERKFLITGDEWRSAAKVVPMRQAYLASGPLCSVRVRVTEGQAMLNIKGKRSGISRDEYEYEIPRDEGEELLTLRKGSIVEKTRHIVRHGTHTWEIDVFSGDNEGLIVAEVELDDEDEVVSLPSWVGEEVTYDHRYLNSYLAQHPFSTW